MDLNCTEEQKTAIYAPFDKPVAIVACPGSGKTFTIIHRVAHLLRSQFKPSDLLVITFTRKASQELKSRLKSMKINVTGLTVQTFHSFGLLILRSYKHLINIGEFRIITQKEQMEILESIAKATPNKEILLRLQIYKTQGQCDEELRPIFDSYNKTLRQMNACDFTDLIVLPLEILRRNPEVVAYYQRRYKYALVDEMQDVSKVQFDFMKLLFGDRGRLTVVGDDDQTIYSWRGADASLLLQFTKIYQQANIIRLTNCFRCPPHIVKAMSKVIQNNKSRVKKTIESMVKSNSPSYLAFSESRKIKKITIYGANSLKDEAYLVAMDLKRVINKGTIAILFRTRKAAQYIKSEMAKQNVFAAVYDKARFLEDEDVNIVLNILQMSVGIPYNKNFVRPNLLAIIRMGIVFSNEKKEQEEAKQKSQNLSSQTDLVSVSDDKEITENSSANFLNTQSSDSKKFLNTDSDIELDEIDDIDSIIENAQKNVQTNKFLSSTDDDIDDEENDFEVNVTLKINSKDVNKSDDEPSEKDDDFEFVKKSLRKMKPLEAIKMITTSLNMEESDSINFLIREAREMQDADIEDIVESNDDDDEDDQMDLIDFLYSIRTSTTEESGDSNNVHMSTIHQAKGLEWDYVYIIGASKGSWPSTSSTAEGNEAKLEEERRLFYVAMSRAKKELTISFLNDRGQSMFIDEIPEIFIKERIHRRTDSSNETKINDDNNEGSSKVPSLKMKFSPDDLKFKKVSSMADSQPMTQKFSNSFVSASNLKLNLSSESQNDMKRSTLQLKEIGDKKEPMNTPKSRVSRPQLTLLEEKQKTTSVIKKPVINFF